MLKFLRYLLLTMVVSVSSLSGMAFYDSESWCNYKILTNSDEDGYTVELTSSDLLDVSVPSSVRYGGKTYTVVGVGTGAFKNKTLNIDKFTLPNTLEYIGEQAFYNTKFQTPNKTRTYSLSLPSNITAIGREAFMNAYAHNEGRIAIYLPSALKEITYRCFFQADFQSVQVNKACTAIKGMAFNAFTGSISVPTDNSIISMEGSPFYNSQLTTINLPMIESVETVSFSNCPVLTSISIGDKISIVPPRFLSNCSYLSEVEFKGDIEEIGANAFQGCSKLKKFKFGNVLQKIGDYAFDGCEQMEYFEFPECLKNIGNYSFRGCKNFTELYFPDEMESIGAGAFALTETRRILLNSTIKSIGRNAFSFIGGAEWLLKSAKPTEVLNSLLPLPSGVQLYIPDGCRQNYEYVTGWSWQDLEDKAGEYKILPTWSLTNYSSKYGETIEPKLSYYPCEYLTGDEQVGTPVIASAYKEWKNAGSYPVVLSWNNTPHSKFIVLLEKDWNISKAVLTATAADVCRPYGQPNPEVGIAYSGFMYEDNESVIEKSPVVTIDATEETTVGKYPITLSGGETQNYEFKYVGSELTIEKAPQVITWNQEFEKVYEGQKIELDAEASSGLPVSYTTISYPMIILDGNMVRFLFSGSGTLTAKQSGNENYLPADPVEKVINVKEYVVEKITLDESEINIKEGEYFQLTASWEPSEIQSPELNWYSTNYIFATVDNTGLVFGIREGKTIVTVRLKDNPKISASCTVNVGIESGLNNIESSAGHQYRIEQNKLIIISELTSPVRIYSVEGRMLYQGVDREIRLNEGIYILCIDGKAIKIKI